MLSYFPPSLSLCKWCFIFTVCGKKMPEVFGSSQHRGKKKKEEKKLHSGVRSSRNIYLNYVTKKNSKHFITCGKVIAPVQKGCGIQDHRKFITIFRQISLYSCSENKYILYIKYIYIFKFGNHFCYDGSSLLY